MELSGQHHASAALLQGKEPPGWVDFSATVGNWEKSEFSYPCRESNHKSSVVQPVAWSLYRLGFVTSSSKQN